LGVDFLVGLAYNRDRAKSNQGDDVVATERKIDWDEVKAEFEVLKAKYTEQAKALEGETYEMAYADATGPEGGTPQGFEAFYMLWADTLLTHLLDRLGDDYDSQLFLDFDQHIEEWVGPELMAVIERHCL
jgi:hypothetical protein